jgi:preprotein translocase subunit YajC
MFISSAWAQQAGGALPGVPESVVQFLPLILIFAVFYFLLIRPQQRKAKQHREMLAELARGDRIVTNGGLVGTVIKVMNENELQVEISEGVRVLVVRGMIASVLDKTATKSDAAKKS